MIQPMIETHVHPPQWCAIALSDLPRTLIQTPDHSPQETS